MARLLRPYIPIAFRLQVIERQITQAGKETIVFDGETKLQKLSTLIQFMFGDQVVHLDHQPPLGAREKIFRNGVHVGYRPDANDPEYLLYREEAAHRLKTNVRGDGAQHPDRVLIKKMQRLERGPRPKRPSGLAKKPGAPKQKWPSRPFNSKRKSPK